jgi:hypothetical protein
MNDHLETQQFACTKPGFFLVGAPKSGTTAMCNYLAQHPDVYVPDMKEPNFFCTDLYIPQRMSLQEYLSLFSPANGLLCGEGTVWYLYSQQAVQNIYQFNPDAKIIIMLRNPVDYVHSLHSHMLFLGGEVIADFEEALAAEAQRREGKCIPEQTRRPHTLLYTETARFAEQVERYFHVFGRDRVHVIIYDDFKNDTARVFRETLEFLGVSTEFQAVFKVINANRTPRNPALKQLMHSPPASLRTLYHKVMPAGVRPKIGAVVERYNTRHTPRPVMKPETRKQLQVRFAPEVEKLSMLLQRDLTHWSR